MIRFHRSRHGQDGFSLIEVLIAVVVLATGLLALAALQGSLTRNSAEAKARGRIAAMLEARMDELRSVGYDQAALAPHVRAATNCAGGNPVWLCNAQTQASVGSLTVFETIRTYSSAPGGANFGLVAIGSTPASTDAQFKRVILEAEWQDSDGGANRHLGVDSEFSSLAFSSTPLPTIDPNSSSNVSPVVREDDPTEAGMIPIAIGNGSDSAATNPKPIVVTGRNGTTLIETKFNVLTYKPSSGAVQVQQRVETTVVGCRCKYGNQSNLTGTIFAQNFRPTYWDGTKYKTPVMLDSSSPPVAGPATTATQSDLCTDCCRDHQDKSTDTIKFDSFRTDNYERYLSSDLTTPVAQNSNGEYSEACRVIRVDGFWRVATDARVEHFDYIGTKTNATDPTPDSTYTDAYKTFVVDYLKNRFTTPSDGLTAEARYALTPDKKPAQISIQAVNTDKRYLHSHAVLVDYIESVAQQKITSVLAGCTKTNKIDCILPYIPFTTINMTELAAYAASNTQVINVVSGGANFADSSIIQGLVTGRTTATNGQTATSDGKLKKSNSALAGVLPIDPEDADLRPTAQQQFVVGNLSPPVTGASFTVNLGLSTPPMSDGAPANDPGVQWKVGSVSGTCTTATGTSPNPYACGTSSPLGVAASVLVSGYNYATADSPTVTCNGNGNKSATGVTPTPRPVCNRYIVSAANASVGGAAQTPYVISANPGKYTEQTTVNFGTLAPNDVVTLTFSLSGTAPATQTACTLTNGNNPVISSVTWSDPCL